ncbi:glycosyltransferase [Kordiimonas lacus]|uniref:Glycosyltransferase involved in cell wall bisynthesis n=1 Tax=Kordiimonas lacus TaxID=637679 RepID=A0A1G7F8A4_9PROT|nr:glycosyltransferase [Kordiimonas lacus]SDE72122.1 Glycosyltransferase involved in cell wall bisynthesis [Kordiimonas lacus]
MHALVTAPIPSHPQNHGNRARVYAVCREIQARGYQLHYVYTGLEGLSEEQEQAMREAWEHVYVLPRELVIKKRSKRRHHLIDDWHSPAVTKLTNRILDIWDIKLCLANYVWQSAWLDAVPADMPRYIDTHDVFGNRHKALKRDGLEPSWFYTTPKEEAKALARASHVIAIQDEEAKTFRGLTDTPVCTLGFFDPPNFLKAKAPERGAKLKVGYIASDNPINVNALKGLSDALKARPALMEQCEFNLAGPICNTGPAEEAFYNRLGFVPSVEGFYADMDIVLNPNVGGTGLKIKSVEALRFGRPLVATSDAMIGIPTEHPLHACPSINGLCDGLMTLVTDPCEVAVLQQSGQEIYNAYLKAQFETLDLLFPRVDAPKAANQ